MVREDIFLLEVIMKVISKVGIMTLNLEYIFLFIMLCCLFLKKIKFFV